MHIQTHTHTYRYTVLMAAGLQNLSRPAGADAAKPGQFQGGSCFTAPSDPICRPTPTHPTCTHPTSSAQDPPSPPSTPKPSRGCDEDMAADRNCSCQGDGESRIEIAARAGQGVSSDAAVFDVARDSTAASTTKWSSAGASSRRGLDTGSKSSVLHGSRRQTGHVSPHSLSMYCFCSHNEKQALSCCSICALLYGW